MKSKGVDVLTDAFSGPDSGFDYFATSEHYQQLATRILDALCRGKLVLVTGNPAPDLPMLAEALRKTAAPRPVSEVPCSRELDHDQLFGDAPRALEPALDAAAANGTGDAVSRSPIFVFGDADGLSEFQVKELLGAEQGASGGQRLEAGVFLAHATFPDRIDSPLRTLTDGVAAQLSAQHLERDEVEAFIHRQLPADERASLFTPQRIALIAVTSGGDPAAVNRIARRMLESDPGILGDARAAKRARPPQTSAKKPQAVKQMSAAAETVASGDSVESPGSRIKRPRYGAALGLAAIAIGTAALWLIIVAVGSQQLDSLIGLIRDRISPHNNGTAALAQAPAPTAPSVPTVTNPASPHPVAATAASPGATAGAGRAAEIVAPQRPAADAAPSPTAVQPSAFEQSQPSPPPSPTPPAAQLSAAEIAALTARGDAFLNAGDIASARAFFERAANAGDRSAAIRMAVTFDSAFLDRAGVHGLRGDPEQAAFWYRRARDLGAAEPSQAAQTGPSVAPPAR
jgi:hypothetical protein